MKKSLRMEHPWSRIRLTKTSKQVIEVIYNFTHDFDFLENVFTFKFVSAMTNHFIQIIRKYW